ncbi:MAG: serine/threonine protein phosphatase [Alphaproteobacteria bacterium]|nr:serine/threonine protein phosphatase [Alphaproteobacteria bacterium]
MSEIQERLQKITPRRLSSLGRVIVILHRDIMRLLRMIGNAAIGLFRGTGKLADKAVEATARRSERTDYDAGVLHGEASVRLELDDRRSQYPARVTNVPDGQCVYAIGDIHGRCDLLEALLDKIDEDASSLPDGTEKIIVFLGDYIDRGMQSRQVIELMQSERLGDYRPVFLMGNHEEALLRFRDEAGFGAQWGRYGGRETLFSYGVQPPNAQAALDPDAWYEAWQKFRDVLPDQHLEFFQSMKHYITIGDYLFVHAGLRPNIELEDQTADDMLWIRDGFLKDEQAFPYLVVHGHTPSHAPYLDHRRMGLDTGAFTSSVLTAARFFGSDIQVIKTR